MNDNDKKAASFHSFHAGAISGLDVSPVDHFAATIGEDGTVRCWDYVDKIQIISREFKELPVETNITKTNEATLAYHEHEEEEKQALPVPGTVLIWTPLNVSPNGKSVSTGFANGVIRILVRGKSEWKIAHVLKPHNSAVKCMAYSPDGRCLVTVGDDKKLWFIKIEQNFSSIDGVSYIPIAYVTLSHTPTSLSWNENSINVLLTNNFGVTEISKPAEKSNASISFEVSSSSVAMKHWRYDRKVEEKKKVEDEEKKKEEEEEEEEVVAPIGEPKYAIYCNNGKKGI